MIYTANKCFEPYRVQYHRHYYDYYFILRYIDSFHVWNISSFFLLFYFSTKKFVRNIYMNIIKFFLIGILFERICHHLFSCSWLCIFFTVFIIIIFFCCCCCKKKKQLHSCIILLENVYGFDVWCCWFRNFYHRRFGVHRIHEFLIAV